ncbi:GTP-binding protein Rho1 [Ceratobasidium sp. 395]|nr:GTP-binding protein Rho1 [Ceratobasidium sp. 395]
MDILRAIRKWATRCKTVKIPGIDFNKEENALQVQVAFAETKPPTTSETNEIDVKTPQGIAKLSLWDIRAMDDDSHQRLRPITYIGTGIMALVFSMDDSDTLYDLEERWKWEVDHFCPGIPKVVIGCKSDLQNKDSARHVDTQLGVDVAKRIGARHYVECSAQKYVGIEELLACIGATAWETYERGKAKRPGPTSPEIQVTVPKGDAQSEGISVA